MGVKIKMVTGDALAIAQETAKKLGMGANILDAGGLGDAKHQETARFVHPSRTPTVSLRYFRNTNSISLMYCRSAAISSG